MSFSWIVFALSSTGLLAWFVVRDRQQEEAHRSGLKELEEALLNERHVLETLTASVATSTQGVREELSGLREAVARRMEHGPVSAPEDAGARESASRAAAQEHSPSRGGEAEAGKG